MLTYRKLLSVSVSVSVSATATATATAGYWWGRSALPYLLQEVRNSLTLQRLNR